MCAGQISPHDAQVAISSDWESAYRQYVGELSTAAFQQAAPTAEPTPVKPKKPHKKRTTTPYKKKRARH
jgi:hypothetical protein